MKHALKLLIFAVMITGGVLAASQQSHAASCVNGVYRAGCTGPNRAAVVHKTPTYHAKPAVTCANGVYRAGCVGPHGAAAVRK